MERKIYLIFSDSVDTVCEIKGYLRGTEEEAQAYCEDLNKANAEQEKDFVWMELTQLPANQRWKTAMPSGFTTVTKTAERWGVSRARVYYLCKEGRIPGAVFDRDHWCIPVDAEKPKIVEQGLASATEMAEKWGVSYDTVTRMCAAGAIPGVERISRRWLIPEDAVYPLVGYLSVSEMAERWGMNRVPVSRFCKEGRIPGAKRVGSFWYIPVDAKRPADIKTYRNSGYLSATKIAEKWGTSRNFVCKACREGRIPGAEYNAGVWHIPEDAQKPMNKATERLPGYISVMRAAEKWGVSHASVLNAAKQGRITGAECIDDRWHIPENAECPLDRRGKWRRK